MKWDTLRSFVDQQGVFLIHDNNDCGPGFGLLRSLPALMYLGVDEFTYPRSWRRMNRDRERGLLSHDHTRLAEIEYEDQLLAALTNQYYEDETQYSISGIVNRWIDRGTLLVVADHKLFETQQGLRPLYHEPFAIAQRPYTTVYEAFRQWYKEQGFHFPLNDTMNLFLQDNALIYELFTGEELTTSIELFERLDGAPYLPLYDAIATAFQSDDGFGTSPKKDNDLNDLAAWLRRRIEWDNTAAMGIVRTLNAQVAENTRAFDPTAVSQDASMADAHNKARELSDSSLEQTYKEWLLRDPQ